MLKSWKIIVATLVIYTAGLVTGTYLTEIREPRTKSMTRDPSAPRGPRMHDFIQRFGRELELTRSQRTNIMRIIDKSQRRMDALMQEMRPNVHEEFKVVNDEIKQDLSEQQVVKFERLMKNRRGLGQSRGGFGNPRGRREHRREGNQPGNPRNGEKTQERGIEQNAEGGPARIPPETRLPSSSNQPAKPVTQPTPAQQP
jgi:hypothetical protein